MGDGTLNAKDVISLLDLEPLPHEGGYFRQTWVKHARNNSSEPLGTAIYYLITPESWSALHRLAHDEVFHFYLGDPCQMIVATPGDTLRHVRLGAKIDRGEVVQYTVPAGAWQGTRLAPGGEWALLGTTMAPGFTPHTFELATLAALASMPPDEQAVLRAFLS